jgi:hypothetical protein
MDPLMILGQVGEPVHAVLSDLHPVAGPEVLADPPAKSLGESHFRSRM